MKNITFFILGGLSACLMFFIFMIVFIYAYFFAFGYIIAEALWAILGYVLFSFAIGFVFVKLKSRIKAFSFGLLVGGIITGALFFFANLDLLTKWNPLLMTHKDQKATQLSSHEFEQIKDTFKEMKEAIEEEKRRLKPH